MFEGYAESRALMRRRDPAFYWAIRRLPGALRPPMHVLCAYLRVADDLVHDASQPGRLLALDRWERQLHEPAHPIAVALHDAATRHRLPLDELHTYFDALRGDCGPVRMPSWEALDAYADATAGTVGRLVGTLLDGPAHHRRDFGRLAQAFQIVDHLTDTREDRAMDRVYLPVRNIDDEDELRAVVSEGVDRARARFTTCSEAIEASPPEVRPGLRMARAVAEQTLDRIEANGHDVLTRRARPPRWRMVTAAAVALRS